MPARPTLKRNMSFLDNLENSLKSLESRDETAQQDKENRKKQEEDLAMAQALAPAAEQLKNGPFTAALLDEAALIGHRLRTKIHITWLGTTLRLDARERRLELKPALDGVRATFFENGVQVFREPADLTSNGAEFARRWLQ